MNDTEHSAEKDAPRDDHSYWASVCTCGLDEQERTGHYPEHMEWCDVPSPLDDDDVMADPRADA